MGPLARTTSAEDVRQAAEHFCVPDPARLGEGDRVRHAAENLHRDGRPSSAAASRRRVEPIGRRILQIPVDAFRTEASRSALRLHRACRRVPSRGEALVKTGGAGKSVACALCHGDTLRGLGEVPGWPDCNLYI